MKLRWLFVLMACLFCMPLTAAGWGEDDDTGTITGRFMLRNGQPMSGAMVFLFNAATGPAPVLGKYWRVPDMISETDDSGSFSFQPSEGKYYLGAIKRMSESHPMGPPASGDYVYPSHEDEKKGRQKAYRVVKWEVTDAGTIKGVVPFDRDKHFYRGTVSAIEGKVQLPDGTPAEHAIVFAYDNPEMRGSPRYASDPSGRDGRYVLRLGRPGTYYLRVRGVYGGGRPAPGSILGGGEPAGVKVQEGKSVKGIDIQGGVFVNYGEKAGQPATSD